MLPAENALIVAIPWWILIMSAGNAELFVSQNQRWEFLTTEQPNKQNPVNIDA